MSLRLAVFIIIMVFFVVIFTQKIIGLCQDGEVRNCNALGICREGYQVCIGGTWSACDVSPQEERCSDNLDNDCDGLVDENCNCIEGQIELCGLDVGICRNNRGMRTCVNGIWSECIGGVIPQSEIGVNACSNNLDDDCDGYTDLQDSGCRVINPCNDRVKNYDETGVDCGGTCPLCIDLCKNNILDAGEESIGVIIDNKGSISDCGGNCPSCPTCVDRIQNQNEEDIDCGGPCITECEVSLDSDRDGLMDRIELQKGTNVQDIDTDDDGILDNLDEYPLCPNERCDVYYGEDSENCPRDCGGRFSWLVFILLVIILVILLIVYYLIKRSKKNKIKKPVKLHPYFLRESPTKPYSDVIAEKLKKIK